MMTKPDHFDRFGKKFDIEAALEADARLEQQAKRATLANMTSLY